MSETEVKLRTDQKKEKDENRVRRRLIIAGLIFLAFLIGLPIGYGLLGDSSALDIYKPATWKHMFDLIFG